jgi:hypothetical protein
MTPIDPNAVIDAIARHFPDGIEYDNHEAEEELRRALGLDPRGMDRILIDAIGALHRAERLRYSRVGYDTTTLSYTEQARRIALALGINNAFDERCETIANVLAGKTEKKT